MSGWLWVAVTAAGAIGAVLRYVVDGAIADRTTSVFPFGTLVVNLSGSFILGLLSGFALYHGFPSSSRLIIGPGLCGAYTTFSTFTYESIALMQEGSSLAAVLNVGVSLVLGCLAAGAGLALAAL